MDGGAKMGTKVTEPHQETGFECPKLNGTMDEKKSCRECPNYFKCWRAILRVLR